MKNILCAGIIGLCFQAFSQTYDSPISITHDATISDNLSGQTYTTPEGLSSHCNPGQNNKWYRFIANTNYLNLTFDNTEIQGAGITIWSYNAGTFALIECQTITTDYGTIIREDLTIGEEYLLSIRSHADTPYSFELSSQDTRDQELYDESTLILHDPSTSVTDNLSGQTYTKPVGLSSHCNPGQKNKWYRFIANTNYLNLTFDNTEIQGAGITIWSYNAGTFAVIECKTIRTDYETIIREDLTPGGEYLISVRSNIDTPYSFELSSQDTRDQELYDESTLILHDPSTSVTDNLSGQTYTKPVGLSSHCNPGQKNKWYRFIANTNYLNLTFDNTEIQGAGITIWSYNAGTFAVIECKTTRSDYETIIREDLTPGGEYLISIRSNIDTPYSFELSSQDTRDQELYDESTLILHDPSTSVTDNLSGQTYTKPVGLSSHCNPGQKNKWYRFIANTNYLNLTFDNTEIQGAGFTLWSYNAGTFAVIECKTTRSDYETIIREDLTPGGEYLISIRSNIDTPYSFELSSQDNRNRDFYNDAIEIAHVPSETHTDNLEGTTYTNPVGLSSVCNPGQPNRWYRFVATTNTIELTFDNSQIQGAAITLWSYDENGVFAQLECITAIPGVDFEVIDREDLAVGTEYFVSIRSNILNANYSLTIAGGVIQYWSQTGNVLHPFVNTRQVGIGTTDTKGYMLAIDGKAIAEEIKVQLSENWAFPDYVFEKDYELRDLARVEDYIEKNGHLPDIPSAEEVKENDGIDIGEMNLKLLRKIEELTLYLIDQNKEIQKLKLQNSEIEEKLKKIEVKNK